METFVIAAVVACVAWTVTKEEVFREWRDFCAVRKTMATLPLVCRKFFYVWTCEYCFSHWVTATALLITRHTVLYAGWRGYVVALFAIVAVANVYMTMYQILRATLRRFQALADKAQTDAKAAAASLANPMPSA